MNDRSNYDNNQPPEIAQLDMDFKKEISIDEDGIPVLSRRAVARLSGVNVSSIYKNLKSLADARSVSPALIAFNGQDFQGDAPLPDTLAFALITHYALENIGIDRKLIAMAKLSAISKSIPRLSIASKIALDLVDFRGRRRSIYNF